MKNIRVEGDSILTQIMCEGGRRRFINPRKILYVIYGCPLSSKFKWKLFQTVFSFKLWRNFPEFNISILLKFNEFFYVTFSHETWLDSIYGRIHVKETESDLVYPLLEIANFIFLCRDCCWGVGVRTKVSLLPLK